MKDRNGQEITVGASAVVLSAGLSLKGRIGTVGATKESCGALRGRPGVRIDGPTDEDGDKAWGAWCKPEDIAVVPATAAAV